MLSCNFRANRFFLAPLTATALAVIAFGMPSTANAQTYVGEAYDTGTDVILKPASIQLAAVNLRVGDTGALPAAGGSLSQTVLTVSNQTLLTIPVLSVSAGAFSNAATSSTVGQSNQVVSTSTVHNVNLFSSLLTATTVRSDTSAFFSGSSSGSSTIDSLVFAGNSITVTGAANQTINIAGAKLVINEQLYSGFNDVRTTNALHLSILDGSQLTGFVSGLAGVTGDVIVANSSAGFTGVNITSSAAPEPTAALLFIPGAMVSIGSFVRRRKQAAA